MSTTKGSYTQFTLPPHYSAKSKKTFESFKKKIKNFQVEATITDELAIFNYYSDKHRVKGRLELLASPKLPESQEEKKNG